MARPVAKINQSTTLDATYSGYDVYATGGMITLTLASTPADGLDIRVINGDVISGKILNNFPADVGTKLYPKKSVAVNSVDGNWFTTQQQGRWQTLSTASVFVSSLPGASDSNDGLTQNTALASLQAARFVMQDVIDAQQTSPVIQLVAGSSFYNDPLLLGGQPVGTNLIQLSVYGAGDVLIQSDDTPAITVGDNAELNVAIPAGSNLNLFGNRNNHPLMPSGILSHNNGLFDQSGSVTVYGNGTNVSAYFFDGPTPGASIADGFAIGGVFGNIFQMDEGGGRYTLSGGIRPVPFNNSSVSIPAPAVNGGLFAILADSELILGGPSLPPVSAFSTIGQSVIAGLLITNGLVIPGGYAIPPGSGGRVLVSKQ